MTGRNWGIPYQGSKNRIAEALIRALPSGERFVDLFGGGGAMSHIAALSGKYKSVLYSDIQEAVVRLLDDAIAGVYNYGRFTPKFITKAEFDKMKSVDAYIKYIWSFSNNGRDYLFAKESESAKKSVHNFVVFGERDDYIRARFSDIELTATNIDGRRLEWMRKLKGRKESGDGRLVQLERLSQLQQLEQLQRIGKLQQLEELNGKGVELTCMDYREYEHKTGDVVYCDPPYEAARGYGEKFDSAEFYDWADSRDFPVYFSSYDNVTDSRFTPVWAKEKRNLARGTLDYDIRTETMYCNRIANMGDINFEYVKKKKAQEQISIFGE